jgi:hypothetical protein
LHDFDAELLSGMMISVTVAGAKQLSPGTDHSLKVDGSAVLIDSRIYSTLSLKNGAKLSADGSADFCCRGDLSTELTAPHRARGLFQKAETVSDRNFINLARYSRRSRRWRSDWSHRSDSDLAVCSRRYRRSSGVWGVWSAWYSCTRCRKDS